MYKSKLQELCHQRSWSLPEYSTARDGPDHNPRFTSTVTVNGVQFQTADQCRSSKDAHNKAAKLAFDHFTSAPKPSVQYSPHLPHPQASSPSSSGYSTSVRDFGIGKSTTDITLQPTIKETKQSPLVNENPFGFWDNKKPIGHSTSVSNPDIRPFSVVTSQPMVQEMKQSPLVNATPFEVRDDNKSTVVQHLHKNRLQNYAQKRNLPLPVYSCEREGPPHASRFRSKVTVDGQTYESLEFFATIREAENAAARAAYESLSQCEVQEDESGLYKSLLQELVQKKGICLPKYDTTVSGPPHMATFVSSVEIGGRIFRGQEAKNKKQAEMNAAKVAYNDLQERKASHSPTILSSGDQLKEALEVSSSILQSVISTGDFPQIVPSKSNLIIHKEEDEEDKDSRGDSGTFQVKSVVGTKNDIHGIHSDGNEAKYSIIPIHSSIPSPDEEKDTKRNKCSSSSSDIAYAYLRDPFPAKCGSSEDGPSSPSIIHWEVTANSATDSTQTGDCSDVPFCKKVSVYPRKLNMPIPDGASVLPYSDDKWVAVRIDPNQN